ncbi:carbohydrate ABC transporter permease [Sanguibacter antarcticus]|uniref:Carbohydrate ABC transporter membrane protein 1 (CUT1 family) n=1 Tax=Sanguibacter antarcticus TaxID=372484 RepID=A0A2A9E575_9MICO|nr:sugar ABC transporter permease [Sanguibacter antarcticus]PFG33515.1 carbohydrate ABC transporter membrane protein 1 (CUT1 family) [Sanguibacter antarcticus]
MSAPVLDAPGVRTPPQPHDTTAVEQEPVARRSLWARHRAEYLTFLLFVTPNMALIAVFTYRPLLLNAQYSTLQWNLGSSTATVIGLDNYVRWFTDPRSLEVVRVTAIFTLTTVGATLALGLALATVLNRPLRGTTFARSVVFAPYVLSGVGVGMVWLFIFDPTYGALSAVLRLWGATSPEWYLDRDWALAMVIVVYVWKNLGYAAVIYLAALQSVPKDLLDAAALDGAGRSRTFWKITVPLLSPTTFFLVITTVLSSLQSFDLIHVMTKGGPLDGTTTLMYQVYVEAFVTGRAGYSSAISMILFTVLLVMTLSQMRFLETKVHYS